MDDLNAEGRWKGDSFGVESERQGGMEGGRERMICVGDDECLQTGGDLMT